MALELRQNTEVKVRIGPFVAVADGFTPVTTLDLTLADQAELLKHDGVAVVDISGRTCTPVVDCNGWYDLTLVAADTGTLGMLSVVVQDLSLCLPVFTGFVVVPQLYYDNKADIAKQSTLLTYMSGTGSQQLTLTVRDSLGVVVPDVSVSIFNDDDTALITWGQTNSLGKLVRALDNGTYKVRCRKAAWVFTSPETVIVSGNTTATITALAAAPGNPTGPNVCRVYDYVFMPDGITPMSIVNAKAAIVSLPLDSGTMLHTGDEIDAVYSSDTGLLYWDIVQGAAVEFTISVFGVHYVRTVPVQASARLTDIA